MENAVKVRDAQARDIPALARLWHQGWHDAHAKLLPPDVAKARTLQIFTTRLAAGLEDARTVGPIGTPLGLCIVKGDELNQLYVAKEAQGRGVAAALTEDAEMRLRSSGVETAWLTCAIGNWRAARFYEKAGWHLARTVILPLKALSGELEVEVWRYEKRLTARS